MFSTAGAITLLQGRRSHCSQPLQGRWPHCRVVALLPRCHSPTSHVHVLYIVHLLKSRVPHGRGDGLTAGSTILLQSTTAGSLVSLQGRCSTVALAFSNLPCACTVYCTPAEIKECSIAGAITLLQGRRSYCSLPLQGRWPHCRVVALLPRRHSPTPHVHVSYIVHLLRSRVQHGRGDGLTAGSMILLQSATAGSLASLQGRCSTAVLALSAIRVCMRGYQDTQ